MLLILLVVAAAAIAIGVWRKFTSVQWIWLMFGVAITLLALWVVLIVVVIGPEMQRQTR